MKNYERPTITLFHFVSLEKISSGEGLTDWLEKQTWANEQQIDTIENSVTTYQLTSLGF